MYSGPAVPVVLTVVFALTGLLALVEYAGLLATPAAPGRSRATVGAPVEARAAALLHLLMSVAMIAMAWGLGGGAGTASGWVQVAVFGMFAAGFAVAAAVPAGLVRARLTRGFHALTALAMVWMVAAMPALMGTAGATTGGGHHMAVMDMAGMDMAAAGASGDAPAGPAPTWVAVLTGVLVAVLVVVAVLWLVAVVRAPARAALTAALASDTHCRPSHWACCHVLMSGGMAAMLATML